MLGALQKQAAPSLPGGIQLGAPRDQQVLITQSAVFAALAAWTLAGVRRLPCCSNAPQPVGLQGLAYVARGFTDLRVDVIGLNAGLEAL